MVKAVKPDVRHRTSKVEAGSGNEHFPHQCRTSQEESGPSTRHPEGTPGKKQEALQSPQAAYAHVSVGKAY